MAAPAAAPPQSCRRERARDDIERKAPIQSTASNDIAARAAELLARLEAVPLSAPDDPLGFECRLADENGWTLGHALEVVREYRRFLVLTQVAGEPVCPSDDVDRAWHLHITRTADYARWCEQLFDGFLHHVPSRGGAGALARHRAMYEATLGRYLGAFGQRPPPEVWPDVVLRFGPSRTTAASTGWLVPSVLRKGHRLAFAAIAAAALCGIGGLPGGLRALSGPTFVLLALGAIALVAWFGLRRSDAAGPIDERDTLDPHEAAWLAGGLQRMVATALALMVDRGQLYLRTAQTTSGKTTISAVQCALVPDAPPPTHPVEAACRAAVRDGVLSFGRAADAIAPFARATDRRLVAAGLASDDARLESRHARALLAAGTIFALMTARLLPGLASGRPVGLLVLLMIADALLMFALAARRWRATPRGQALLKRLRASVDRARASSGKQGATSAPATTAGLPLALALLGAVAVMNDERFSGFVHAFGRSTPQRWNGNRDDSRDSSCSSIGCGGANASGCGGGGDGGGGGGGGCGGGGD